MSLVQGDVKSVGKEVRGTKSPTPREGGLKKTMSLLSDQSNHRQKRQMNLVKISKHLFKRCVWGEGAVLLFLLESTR